MLPLVAVVDRRGEAAFEPFGDLLRREALVAAFDHPGEISLGPAIHVRRRRDRHEGGRQPFLEREIIEHMASSWTACQASSSSISIANLTAQMPSSWRSVPILPVIDGTFCRNAVSGRK